jgi:hypothetical protein
MILLDDIVEILPLADGDGRAVLLIIGADSCRVGLTKEALKVPGGEFSHEPRSSWRIGEMNCSIAGKAATSGHRMTSSTWHLYMPQTMVSF